MKNVRYDKWEMWEMGNGKKRELEKNDNLRNGRREGMRSGKWEIWEMKNVITDKWEMWEMLDVRNEKYVRNGVSEIWEM